MREGGRSSDPSQVPGGPKNEFLRDRSELAIYGGGISKAEGPAGEKEVWAHSHQRGHLGQGDCQKRQRSTTPSAEEVFGRQAVPDTVAGGKLERDLARAYLSKLESPPSRL